MKLSHKPKIKALPGMRQVKEYVADLWEDEREAGGDGARRGKSASQLRVRRGIVSFFLIGWAICILFSYAVRDARIVYLLYFFHAISRLALMTVIVFLAYLLGGKLYRLLRVDFPRPLEDIVFSSALGLGALGYLVLLLGTVRLLYSFSAYALLAVVAVAVIPGSGPRLARLKDALEGIRREKADRLTVSLLVVSGVSLAVSLVYAFCPPLNYDTLSYHLAFPKLFADAHRVYDIGPNPYANMPFTMEFLFLLGLLLEGDVTARLIHFSSGILAALSIYAFCRRHFTRGTGILAAALFLNVPLVGLVGGWAFNELILTLFGFLALAALFTWHRTKEEKWFRVSALNCGLALGTKYPAFLFCLGILFLGVVAEMMTRSRSPGSVLRKAVVFLLISLAVASPWLGKNLLYTWNPIYPFGHGLFYRLFHRLGCEPFEVARFAREHAPDARGMREIGKLLGDTFMNDYVGVAIWLFVPVLALYRKIEARLGILLLYVGLYLFFWTVATHQRDRFLLPMFPVLGIIAAEVFRRVSWSKMLRAFARGALGISLLFNTWWLVSVVSAGDYLRAAVGVISRDKFLANSMWYQYPAFRYINHCLPPEARVVFVGENQGYYCEREFIGSSPFERNLLMELAKDCGSVREMAGKLGRMGWTHVLLNRLEFKRYQGDYDSFKWKGGEEEARMRFNNFLFGERYLEEKFRVGPVSVYEIRG